MTGIGIDWAEMDTPDTATLRARVFSAIAKASRALAVEPGDAPAVLETVPRLADLVERRPDELADFREPLSALARSCGLWNYIDKQAADVTDLLVAEAVTAYELDGIVFHREQIAALNVLLSGKNLILSAPTSFGKSLLIDALLLSGRYSRVAIVLPTIALLDEFRRRLRVRVGNRYQFILHPSQVANSANVIFLGTQERLIHRPDLGNIDLTVVDEFYKLDPVRRDERSVTLNAAVNKLLNRSRQFFFLGPNIDGVKVSSGERWRFEFLKTRFSTVAVDTLDLRGKDAPKVRLFSEIARQDNWPSLIFMSSPDRANKLAAEASQTQISDSGGKFADWLELNVGSKSPLARAVRRGYALHHGRIQRSIAAQMVRTFNREELPVMFCTSTLIEGVNTAAKTVLIYDKKINKEKYDFFTFSNIKGRAGRLGHHRVGRVFLFDPPPEPEELEVAPTLFAADEDAPDEYLVNLDSSQATESHKSRIASLQSRLELDAVGLRLAGAVGIEPALALKQLIDAKYREDASLSWSGYPDFPKIEALISVILKVRNDFGFYVPRQLALMIYKLRAAATLRSFLREYDAWFEGRPEAYDNVFKFLRSCEYGLPQYVALAELFAKRHDSRVDYSLLVQGLSAWFRPPVLRELDEEGIAIQISERYYTEGDSIETLREKLAAASMSSDSDMSDYERAWVSDALG